VRHFGVSIDPNPTRSGIALWELLGQWEPVEAITVTKPTNEYTTGDPLVDMVFAITDWPMQRTRNKGSLDWAACEGAYVGPSGRETIDLAELVGAIQYHYWDRRFWKFTTAEIDSACKLYYAKGGRKDATRRFAETLWPTAKLDEHQCDAVCAGFAACGKLTEQRMLTLAESENDDKP
jgi:hypothetical protein